MFEQAINTMEEVLSNKGNITDRFKKHLILFKNNKPVRELPGSKTVKHEKEDKQQCLK